jgi:hypothetical protein
MVAFILFGCGGVSHQGTEAFDQDLSGWQVGSVRAFQKARSYVWVDDCGNPFPKTTSPVWPAALDGGG